MNKIEPKLFSTLHNHIEVLQNGGDFRTANHFFRIVVRLQKGWKLTKKMSENLEAMRRIMNDRETQYRSANV
jgi:hypothetical protein